ncbi:MAG: hypothetical protein CMI16_05475 [Opitutaceae bacterium]|nr:hypothetical protein [Opitutaceae bacterium]|tara:strand:- start:1519 stop:1755 length:237 start_codon:yes stop_codon:yes gene_type:complete
MGPAEKPSGGAHWIFGESGAGVEPVGMPMQIVLETKPNGEGFTGLNGLSFADQSRVFLSPSSRERVCALIGNELKSPT